MRYEELPGPLAGWTYDENGTVYTASGYRCDARHCSQAPRWLRRTSARTASRQAALRTGCNVMRRETERRPKSPTYNSFAVSYTPGAYGC